MWSLSVECDSLPKLSKETSVSTDTDEKMGRKPLKHTKPRLKPPSALERVFGRSLAAKDHYFTAGVKINEDNQRNIHAEVLPFKYPKDLEEFSFRVMTKAWRNNTRRKANKLKYCDRPNYRLRQKLDLLNRLYVKDPDTKNIKTIVDLDPEFFTLVEGRPLTQKFNRLDYIKNIRHILRLKVITGFREDDIMLIEENFAVEQKVIDEIKEEFQKYVNTFEDFLFTDHTNSMNLLRISDEEATISSKRLDTFRELSKEYGSLKSTVYNLEEKWRNCKMYQKFLYLISPMEWRQVHDFYYSTTSREDLTKTEEQSTIFDRSKIVAVVEALTLRNLVEKFLYDIQIQSEPQLFFTTPEQLFHVFRFIETQNLNTLLHSEELAIPLGRVKETKEKTATAFAEEISALEDIIDSLEGEIIWEEERAKYLEELAIELINGGFRELICDDEAVNLYVFVEDVFESRIDSNESNLTMSNMMRMIELNYRRYLLKLDRLPDSVVRKAEMTSYKDEARMMKTAKDAAKKVVQVERLMKHLAKLLEPPVYKKTRSLMWRSTPLDSKVKPPSPPKPLTQEEIDYLTFFADFCKDTDNPRDFGIRAGKSNLQ